MLLPLVASLCWAADGFAPPAGVSGRGPVAEPPPITEVEPADRAAFATQATIELRSEMSAQFRLVEVRFVIDGRQVAANVAEEGKELAPRFGPLQARLPRGKHVLTAMAVYEARASTAPSQLDRYPAESVVAFTTERTGATRVRVVVREQPGADVPIHQKPTVFITTNAARPQRRPATTAAAAPAPAPNIGKTPTKAPEKIAPRAPTRQAARPRRDGGLTSARTLLGY